MEISIHLVKREPSPFCSMSDASSESAARRGGGADRSQSHIDGRIGGWVADADRDAFKVAFYNVVLFAFVAVCVTGALALYHLLYAFLKPMMWAALAGTLLFPAKRQITDAVRGWLRSLRETGTPLAVGVARLPLSAVDSAADRVCSVAMSSRGVAVAAAYVTLAVLTWRGTFLAVVRLAARVYSAVDAVVILLHGRWVCAFFVVYMCVYVAWALTQPTEGDRSLGHVLALPAVVWLVAYVAGYFGVVRVPVFVAANAVLLAITLGVLRPNGFAYHYSLPARTRRSTGDDEAGAGDAADEQREETANSASSGGDEVDELSDGDMYLRGVFAACLLLWAVKHTSTLVLVVVLFVIGLSKRLGAGLGLWSTAKSSCTSVAAAVGEKAKMVVDAAVPSAVRSCFRLIFSFDQKLIVGLEQSMDRLSSVIVMILVFVGTVLLGFFVVFQLHAETLHLARLASNVLSGQGGEWMSVAANFTDQQLSEHDMDEYVEQAFTHGRVWLAGQVRRLADAHDTQRADMLEAQVQQVADHLYAAWHARHAADDAPKSALTSDNAWTHLLHVTDLAALRDELTLVVKENIGTLVSVAESVWSVLAANVSFLGSILAATLGILLSFGLDLLNLVIGVIVFLTMVYHLLASSKERWAPLDWLAMLTPSTGERTSGGGQVSLSASVEQAISGVFLLSIKMALFYGLYTWFVHTLFDLNVVFLPSMLASVFAAVPLTAPYWVSVVGVLELWLVRGETVAAVLFFVCSLAPMLFADYAFYHEVKGSHPYLTGLSIIGGMYWLGLEGAIIGPIIVCFVMVLWNVYTTYTA